MMNWKNVALHGSNGIARVCGEYEITDTRLPAAKYKIKVLERRESFFASPNVAVKESDGTPEWIGGLGRTELEALQDAIARMGERFALRSRWNEDELEWSDPRDF
ncbi:hypothetical protein LVJ94_46405 [Pendulispora rubella]|uniref:DUF5675 domain-containing protein n=1 Tax=Pendulispora rubella TaxID=2741070 RepID=A0ABZ2L058_9BACT